MAVYGSQADISAACGFARNDGRVYAYLRGLAAGGVARCDRGVVLFDPQRLELMERALVVRRLTPRAMEVAGILRQTFGRPAADGTVTLERDSGQNSGPPTPPRLADMGDALGMTRSSAQRHVSSLRSHGYLVGGRWRGGPFGSSLMAAPSPAKSFGSWSTLKPSSYACSAWPTPCGTKNSAYAMPSTAVTDRRREDRRRLFPSWQKPRPL